MKKNATLLIILLVISIVTLSGCNEKSSEENLKGRFVGSWQPDKVLMGDSNHPEIWTFYANNTVKVAVYSEINKEENRTYYYDWENNNNSELYVIPPDHPSEQFNGSYEFNNDYTSFSWVIKKYVKEDVKDIINYTNVTFNKI
jgi:hypothetical protein